MSKPACGHAGATYTCSMPACLTYPVCRSHLRWWARHHPLEFIQAGARIRNIGAPTETTMIFAHGLVADTFCEAFADIRGGLGCDSLLHLWIAIHDVHVIADWLESVGEDPSGLRRVVGSARRQTSWGFA